MKPTLNDHTLTSVWRGALTPTMPHSSLSAAADATGAEPTLDAQNLEYISSAGLRYGVESKPSKFFSNAIIFLHRGLFQ